MTMFEHSPHPRTLARLAQQAPGPHEAMQIQQHLAAQDAMLASLIAATKAAMPPPAQPA